MITVDIITDEQIVEATSFDPRVRESNVELIQLRARALTGQGHGYDVTAEMRQTARARCAEILNARNSSPSASGDSTGVLSPPPK